MFLYQRRRRRQRTTGTNSPPNTPTISAGTPTSSGVTLTGSAFSDPDVGDTHAASQWQVTTSADTNYLSPVISTGDDATNKTSYAASGLSASTGYIARARYKDSAGNYSAWSSDASFTTAAGSSSTVSAPTMRDSGTQGTGSTTGATTFSTASVTPSASAVTVVKVVIASQVGTSTPTISGARGTWTLVGSQVNASGNSRVYVWVGTGTATTGAITVTRASTDTWGPALWTVEDYEGGHQTTPVRVGSTNGVQKTSTDAFITVPTLLTMTSGNALVAAFFITGGVAALAPGSGWTEPVADQTVTSSSVLETQYRLSTDTQATVTGSISGAQGGGLLFELAHA